MSKQFRGKGIKKNPGWRGICPICKKTGVKLLWNKDKENVCKICYGK